MEYYSVTSFGEETIMCAHGDSPGIYPDGTSWRKNGIVDEVVIDVSSDCPICSTCEDVLNNYKDFPTVKNRTMQYEYSAFVIASTKQLLRGVDVSDCLDIENRFVTFMVVRSFSERDEGKFDIIVQSKAFVPTPEEYEIQACKLIVVVFVLFLCAHTHTHTHTSIFRGPGKN